MNGSTLFGGTVLTCEDSSVIENGAVVIDGEKIAWVGQTAALPESYRSEKYTQTDSINYRVTG